MTIRNGVVEARHIVATTPPLLYIRIIIMSENKPNITVLKDKVLAGGELSEEEIYSLCDADSRELRDAAAEVTARFCPRRFDSCSIINARSGKCSENCKWCAQSAHYSTGCHSYPMVDHDECMHAARLNHSQGVRRFSLVASGQIGRAHV